MAVILHIYNQNHDVILNAEHIKAMLESNVIKPSFKGIVSKSVVLPSSFSNFLYKSDFSIIL